MSITRESELIGMKKVSDVVAYTLKEMKSYARPGMTTKKLDDLGASILKDFGATAAPFKTYRFPGCTCISNDNTWKFNCLLLFSRSSNKIIDEKLLTEINRIALRPTKGELEEDVPELAFEIIGRMKAPAQEEL